MALRQMVLKNNFYHSGMFPFGGIFLFFLSSYLEDAIEEVGLISEAKAGALQGFD